MWYHQGNIKVWKKIASSFWNVIAPFYDTLKGGFCRMANSFD